MAHVNRKEYWIIFAWLFVLTVLEVAIVFIDMPKSLLVGGLVAMAIAKAMLVGLYYMHLKHETRVLQFTVLIPMLMPMAYAVVLIADAWWRYAYSGMHYLTASS